MKLGTVLHAAKPIHPVNNLPQIPNGTQPHHNKNITSPSVALCAVAQMVKCAQSATHHFLLLVIQSHAGL